MNRRQRKAKAQRLTAEAERIDRDGGPFENFNRADAALLTKAIVEGWDVKRESRIQIMSHMLRRLKFVESDSWDSDARLNVSVLTMFLAMVRADQRVEHRAWKRGDFNCFGPWAEAFRCPVGLSKKRRQAIMQANDEYFAELKKEAERQAEAARKQAVYCPVVFTFPEGDANKGRPGNGPSTVSG